MTACNASGSTGQIATRTLAVMKNGPRRVVAVCPRMELGQSSVGNYREHCCLHPSGKSGKDSDFIYLPERKLFLISTSVSDSPENLVVQSA